MTATDIVGVAAVQRLEAEWFRSRIDGRSQQDQDDIREAICLARGWRFER